MAKKDVANPGSALGEAIGVIMENALNRNLKPLIEALGHIYISAGPKNPKNGKDTKLILKDKYDVEYSIDSLIVNKSLQPIIVLESKYIRYKKHNRDKGSWIKASHTAIRERYSSVRSSIAILAGSWSAPSKAMLKSADINYFEIPFEKLCEILDEYGIDFRWGEKEREKAYTAWNIFCKLSTDDLEAIGNKIIDEIALELDDSIKKILDDSVEREIVKIEIHVTTNLGEVKIFSFDDIEAALEFLNEFDTEEILDTSNAPSILEDNTNYSQFSSKEPDEELEQLDLFDE